MSEKIKLVQGDTRPQIKVTLTDDTTGLAIDITGATVRMKFRAAGATVLTDTLTGIVLDGPAGVVVFPWNATTLDCTPGDYEGEIEITFAAGAGIQTAYQPLKFQVRAQF